jgi:hypothetical protein
MAEILNYWNQFPKTDEKYTKSANVDGNKLTSLDGVYMVKLATEVLGPIGVGWGYRIVSERMDNGKPIILIVGNESQKELPIYMMDNGSIVFEKTHTLLLEMWIGEKNNSFSQYGHTKFTYMTSKGKYFVDHEYAKKSVTDAMKKCLSLVGVCSDVFMGEFDDQGYKQVARLENDLAKADKSDAVYAEKVNELREFINLQAVNLSLCPTLDAMQKVYTVANGKVRREAPIIHLDAEVELVPINGAYFKQEQNLKGTK